MYELSPNGEYERRIMARTLVTGRESMTSKERVQAFFRGEETDRVPINMA